MLSVITIHTPNVYYHRCLSEYDNLKSGHFFMIMVYHLHEHNMLQSGATMLHSQFILYIPVYTYIFVSIYDNEL